MITAIAQVLPVNLKHIKFALLLLVLIAVLVGVFAFPTMLLAWLAGPVAFLGKGVAVGAGAVKLLAVLLHV